MSVAGADEICVRFQQYGFTTPSVVKSDPVAEADAAADSAAKAANADVAARKKRKAQSLLETGAGNSLLSGAGGKTSWGHNGRNRNAT
ncbi:hypothetical protein [Erwinia psidii]|uniref:Uncharacterized protein n=1 Tax=Erwinia psidii TaxID=69224 RepID=A0A3N6S692_9GAMM|nr:hypothetical protein [Erwinia psidii]MCX8956405.1 hypothetical protein [Erwinia psidii]MCX8959837.1 hypothetical protein [Erwinia psidii]MCX8966468.1 hypothetical protein [Erwinia psidii]RQM36540.1 hypothetical protein EB241_19670 [Erwinia psidii]